MLVPVTVERALEGTSAAISRAEAVRQNCRDFTLEALWSQILLSLQLRRRVLTSMDASIIVYINSDTYPNGPSGNINVDGLIFDELFGSMQA